LCLCLPPPLSSDHGLTDAELALSVACCLDLYELPDSLHLVHDLREQLEARHVDLDLRIVQKGLLALLDLAHRLQLNGQVLEDALVRGDRLDRQVGARVALGKLKRRLVRGGATLRRKRRKTRRERGKGKERRREEEESEERSIEANEQESRQARRGARESPQLQLQAL
jgi:hypothetical protein